jgi:hypothetical protein
MTATAKPRRRWMQFSLKGLMLLVVVAAIPCGWLKWKMVRKARERVAVAEIERVGGQVGYDWEGKKEPPGSEWLRKLLGDDFFSSVVGVELQGHHVTDEWLTHLEPLSDLSKVSIHSADITDVGLAHLARLSNLTDLSLPDTQVTDKGLEHLSKLSRLAQLGLWNTDVTDTGLTDLTKLMQLSFLDLKGTAVSDNGLAHLQGLTGLSVLNLTSTNVTAAGVAELQKALPKCKILGGRPPLEGEL